MTATPRNEDGASASAAGPARTDRDAEAQVGLLAHADGRLRCWWAGDDPRYVAYHDLEWGRPVVDERALFEKLCLEGFQAGLAWRTILHKRAAFREVFAGFDPQVVAGFDDDEVEHLLTDARIVRSRAKIEAVVSNARALLALWDADQTLTDLVWRHAPPPRQRPATRDEVPVTTPASRALATSLRTRGFRFIGPTSAYAYLQSMGLVDDHLEGCHVPVQATGPDAR